MELLRELRRYTNYWGTTAMISLILLMSLSLTSAAPTSSAIFEDAAYLQEHIRVIKDGSVNPLIKRFRFERYHDDAVIISDLEKWAETSYSKEVKDLPEIEPSLDFGDQLAGLIRQAHENCAWMVLWMRHIASQEALHERGVNYMSEFLDLEQKTNQLLLRLEVMAEHAGVRLDMQLKNMHLNSPPEFENHSFRRFHHYVQLYHHNLLMNAISERFITLGSHVNTVWKRR